MFIETRCAMKTVLKKCFYIIEVLMAFVYLRFI